MKKVSVLCAALFCTALSAQETGVPAGGAPLAAEASQHGATQTVPAAPVPAAHVPVPIPAAPIPAAHVPAAPIPAAHAPAAPVPAANAPAAPIQAAHDLPAAPIPEAPAQAAQAPAAPAPAAAAPEAPKPAGEMTRADSALGVYRSARDAIIGVNRKFPRPMRLTGKAADTARTPKEHHTALASAEEAVRSAWAAMGIHKPRPEHPIAEAPLDAATLADLAFAPALKGAPAAKTFKGQAALGLLIPLNPSSKEPNFKPWWNMAYHMSYREMDVDARFSGGLGVDLSLYTFSKKDYINYYESKDMEDSERRADVSVSSPTSMLMVDLGYYLKFYPVNEYKIPYINGSIGLCGTFGGSAKTSYTEFYYPEDNGEKGNNKTNKEPESHPFEGKENMIKDVYVFGAAVGVGVDYPVYAGIRAFGEIQYSMRFGLYSLFDKDGKLSGSFGFVPQIPIRFGVMVPFSAMADLLKF